MGGVFESLFSSVKEPPVVGSNSKEIRIATLNYCGIAYSPFEFYIKGYEKEIERISSIFHSLIPKYVPNFNEKTFKWDMGKIDKTFKKGRYSNMFDPLVGLNWYTLLDRKQFELKWEEEFARNKASFKFEWKNEEKETVRIYDFIMYHTLLEYAFDSGSFQEAIKNDGRLFLQKIEPLYKLSFLNQQKKFKKFKKGFQRINADVFFIQEYSSLLLNNLRNDAEYIVAATDPKEDSLILLKKKSFQKVQDFSEIYKEINSQQQKNFRWAESVAFTGADDFIFACIHLSSNEEKNKIQIENLKNDLVRLKDCLPKYQIIVGGDINSFLEPEGRFKEVFDFYPQHKGEFTTLKKRTYSQAQFHKADKEIKESKDRIISTLPILKGEITYFDGQPTDVKAYLPCDDHPYDHLLVSAIIGKK